MHLIFIIYSSFLRINANILNIIQFHSHNIILILIKILSSSFIYFIHGAIGIILLIPTLIILLLCIVLEFNFIRFNIFHQLNHIIGTRSLFLNSRLIIHALFYNLYQYFMSNVILPIFKKWRNTPRNLNNCI